jgi:hypothetical protein
VTKQLTLTGFPPTLFANSKRRLQASLRAAREQTIRQSICGYALLFSDALPPHLLEANDPTRRQRHYGHIPVFWAWLSQILEANASCSKALASIQAWYRASSLPVPCGDTSGYCNARTRLTEGFLQASFDAVNRSLQRSIRSADLWHGHPLKAIDGSSVQLMDTPANQAAYPQSSSQKPGCGFPMMGIVGVLNLSHGGWEGFETCDQRTHDANIAPRLLKHIHAEDILLADRAFCSYELLARIQQKGAHSVMRLHQIRHAKLDWRKGKKIDPNQRLVTWQKPYRPKGSSLTPDQWQALPDQMTLRYIKTGYEDRAGAKRSLIIVTNLLDTAKYKEQDLADLYSRRWQIELNLRDVKTTLGMERFAVKSPAMAHKTLWMMLIAYNLLRSLIQQAAAESGSPLNAMSFKGILDQVLASQDSFLMHRSKPRCMAHHRANLITICSTKRLEIRPFRKEPRAVKQRPKNYPLLTSYRSIYQEIPHRGKPHKAS